MKIVEAVEDAIKSGSHGKGADVVGRALLVNVIRDEQPFQAIELRSREDLLVMMRGADRCYIYGESGVFYFSAYYFHSNEYPVGRTYFLRKQSLVDVGRLRDYFVEFDIHLSFVPPPALGDLIKKNGFELRIKKFKEAQAKKLSPFKGLFEGRKASTNLESSIFLNSDGCLVCGASDTYIATSTLTGSTGFMVGLYLCDQHLRESKAEASLIEYLAKKYKQDSPVSMQPLSVNEHILMILDWLPDAINCSIEKVLENTVTLTRKKSGFKLVMRLDSPLNYAYMIFNPNGKQVARIDSADHHQVPYGPDHVHEFMSKKAKVESSFTSGSPLIDTKKIIALLESKELAFSS